MSEDTRSTKHIVIVAECGHNHNGDMKIAKKMIHEAKENGADIVKFQAYNTDRLVTNHYDELKKSELTREQIEELVNECQKTDIEFMASAFDTERLKWIVPFSNKLKLASRSVYNLELRKAMADTGMPIIASLGKYKEPDFPTIRPNNTGVYFLYCSAQYPTRWEDLNFLRVGFDRSRYTGFSDHTIGIEAALTAVSRGAKIIEKHFTLDKKMEGCDQECSMTPKELKTLVKRTRDIEKILYYG